MSRFLHLALSLAAVGLLLGADCGGGPMPTIVILSPAHGTFTTASNVTISGQVTSPSVGLEVRVNEVPVSLNLGNGSWSTTRALDANAIVNPFVASLVRTSDGHVLSRQRIVVHAASSVADGAFTDEGVALRINDTGLDQLEPVIESQIDLDLATLLPVGTVVVNNECFLDSIFGCIVRASVTVANPPPTISGFSFDADSQTNAVFGQINVYNIQVQLQISGGISCGLRINASSAQITGSYALQPAADPSNVDVNLIGAPGLVLAGFDHTFTSGVCDWFLIGDIIQAAIGDVRPTVEAGLREFLDDDDGNGPADSPLADAFETALADISITGPISEALGVNLEAPLQDVLEDTTGITLESKTRVTSSVGTGPGQCEPPAGTPDLTASYHIGESFPDFGSLAPPPPPYHIGIAISTSAFNQLLKAQIECGLLRVEMTEIDLGLPGGPVPLTAGVLGMLIEGMQSVPAATPMRIVLTPTLAPFLTGNAGPGGELGEIRVGQYRIDLVVDDSSREVKLGGAIDFRAGLTMSFNDLSGQLEVGIGSVAAEDITLAVIENPIDTDETQLQVSMPTLIAGVLPQLGEGLGAFPIPGFMGLSLQGVEVRRAGSFYSLLTKLAPAP